MKNYLKYIAVGAMYMGVAAGSFFASGQTSKGRFTVNMPHGPVVMEIGRKSESGQSTKKESPNKKNKVDKGSEPLVTEEAPKQELEKVTSQPEEISGVIFVKNEGERFLKYGELTYNFAKINSRTFKMGATEEQGEEAETVELPRHNVDLFAYWLGITEVPQWLWKAIMKDNPSKNVGDDNPVENVSWEDCNVFVTRLSELTGAKIGLPTEAQMELAIRNGLANNDNKYGSTVPLAEMAWYSENSDGHTHQVGLKRPNKLGLYDITGNVGEWCYDWFDLYSEGQLTNPKGPDTGTKKVYKSAGYNSPEKECRSSARFAETPDFKSPAIGLRLVLK